MSPLTESVRHAYQAFAEDPESMWHRFDDEVVFHVSGDHPCPATTWAGRDPRATSTPSGRRPAGGRASR